MTALPITKSSIGANKTGINEEVRLGYWRLGSYRAPRAAAFLLHTALDAVESAGMAAVKVYTTKKSPVIGAELDARTGGP